MGDDNCRLKDKCRNYDKRCIACVDESQYKAPKSPSGLSSGPSSSKKGMGFEDKVKELHDKTMSKRMPNSGAYDFFEGDVSFEEILSECKERGMTNAQGEKVFTIKKKWLEKIENEALKNNKLPAFVFRYKNDDNIYFTMEYDFLLDLLLKLQELKESLEELRGV